MRDAMPNQIFFRGLAVVGAFALLAVFAATAIAQAAPLRIVQASNGTLYLVQAGKSWTLVPERISDSDLAALRPRGKFVGAIPAQFQVAAQPPAAAPAQVAAPEPPPPAADVLTDSARADILSAVDRGNAAWTAAQLSLDPADLQSGLTGVELSSDISQLAQFRSSGQKRKAVNTGFTVLDVSLDSATQATVHTQETWSDDVYSTTTGALIRHDPATSYSETYTVDLLDGHWIVSQIQLQ
jgi:hypothetical protein